MAITCRDDADWGALVDAMGAPQWATSRELATATGRAAYVDVVEQGLREWTATLQRSEVAELLQKAGVPAGELLTALESIENEHYLARGFRVELDQPGVVTEHIVLDGPGFSGSKMSPVYIAKAPWVGEHTRRVCQDLLEMDSDEIERLVSEGALEVTPSS